MNRANTRDILRISANLCESQKPRFANVTFFLARGWKASANLAILFDDLNACAGARARPYIRDGVKEIRKNRRFAICSGGVSL